MLVLSPTNSIKGMCAPLRKKVRVGSNFFVLTNFCEVSGIWDQEKEASPIVVSTVFSPFGVGNISLSFFAAVITSATADVFMPIAGEHDHTTHCRQLESDFGL